MIGEGDCSTIQAWKNERPMKCGPFGDLPAVTIGESKPNCWGGKMLGPWKDGNGVDRYACLFEPDSSNGPLPLVIFLHPSLLSADTIHLTNLLHYQNIYPLSGDSKRPGFSVLAPQGLSQQHHYPVPDARGKGWDNWYRQLSPRGSVLKDDYLYRENVDASTIDHFVADQVAAGKVDTQRVFVTGWSNGGAMGLLYALNRPTIAALAVYSAPDPFGAFNDPCSQTPVKKRPADNGEVRIYNPGLPVMHVHNNCDVAGLCPNSEHLAGQLRAIGVEAEDTIINFAGQQVTQCMPSCGTNPNGDTDPSSDPLGWSLGLAHHLRWPLTWTSTMLDFFRSHPFKPRR